MGFDCLHSEGGGGGVRSEEARLNLVLHSEEEDNEKLLKGRALTKHAYVELKEQGQSPKLWPILLEMNSENDFMKIERDSSSKKLKVVVGKFSEAEQRGNMEMRVEENKKEFVCDAEGVFKSGSGTHMIYQGIMKQVIVGQ